MSLIEVNRHEHHSHEHHTMVREVRAPTDESLRLLREMEREAREAILDSVRVTDSAIEMVVHQADDFVNGQRLFKSIYKVNGARREVLARVNNEAKSEEIAEKLIADVARDIAASLLVPHLNKVLGKKW